MGTTNDLQSLWSYPRAVILLPILLKVNLHSSKTCSHSFGGLNQLSCCFTELIRAEGILLFRPIFPIRAKEGLCCFVHEAKGGVVDVMLCSLAAGQKQCKGNQTLKQSGWRRRSASYIFPARSLRQRIRAVRRDLVLL